MKYPVLIPYIHTPDNGEELRHALRSLKNITNWNGEVYIVGDKEHWFSDRINYIANKRVWGAPYLDQEKKMLYASEKIDGDFIVSMDDVYITEPTKIGAYNAGELKDEQGGYHKLSKSITLKYLKDQGYTNIIDFETHTPMLVNNTLFSTTLYEILKHSRSSKMLQWRSVYGNGWAIDSKEIVDKKTRNDMLPDGPIISTNYFVPTLKDLFPEKSEFER